MKIIDAIKAVWGKFTLKAVEAAAIDSLDRAEPFLSAKLDEAKSAFTRMTSQEQAKWIIDKVQDFLRNKAGIIGA